MKKFLGLMAAVIISTTAVFADNYKGDFQLLFGAGFDSITATKNVSGFEYKREVETGLGMLNFETWHVFGSSDVFKLGFMVAFNEGLGGTMKYAEKGTLSYEVPEDNRFFSYRFDFFVAPAFSFFVGDVVRFNVAPGLSILFAELGSYTTSHDVYFIGASGVGVGVDVQAKFCPNARVSPVIGYKFTANFTDSITDSNTHTNQTNTPSYDSVVILTNTFNIGISWNW